MFNDEQGYYFMFWYKEDVGVLGTRLHFKESSWYFETEGLLMYETVWSEVCVMQVFVLTAGSVRAVHTKAQTGHSFSRDKRHWKWSGPWRSLHSRYHNVTLVTLILFTRFGIVRPSPCRSSRRSQVSSSIMWRSLIPNFTQIGQQMWEVRMEIGLRPAII